MIELLIAVIVFSIGYIIGRGDRPKELIKKGVALSLAQARNIFKNGKKIPILKCNICGNEFYNDLTKQVEKSKPIEEGFIPYD